MLNWLNEIGQLLSELRGPFMFLESEEQAVTVQYCDGHGVHSVYLDELRDYVKLLRQRWQQAHLGEDGTEDTPAKVKQDIVNLYAIVKNARRIETPPADNFGW